MFNMIKFADDALKCSWTIYTSNLIWRMSGGGAVGAEWAAFLHFNKVIFTIASAMGEKKKNALYGIVFKQWISTALPLVEKQ